jgi:hypothetical protein
VVEGVRGVAVLNLGKRLKRKLTRKVIAVAGRARDVVWPTYALREGAPAGEVARLIAAPFPEILEARAAVILEGAERACAHSFDLLGSGWTHVVHGTSARGVGGHRYGPHAPLLRDEAGRWVARLVNPSNARASAAIAQLLSPAYRPIDWQLDFKSGYRFSERVHARAITYGDVRGVDIKVPWELARMQHLAALAHAFGIAKRRGETTSAATFLREVKDQILDFIAANPPRYGVNWVCTMDVAIRAANWLAAVDLLRAYGAELDSAFMATLRRSALEHAKHIVANLEWFPELRSNHYLANVAGLVVIAAYLPTTPETTAWLGFGVHELIVAMREQFHPDGGNFEASTSYHRLSGEMIAYGTAFALAAHFRAPERLTMWSPASMPNRHAIPLAPLMLRSAPGAGTTPFPTWYFERLARMADFTIAATAPDGHIVLIGDNDDGRFLELEPAFVPAPGPSSAIFARELRDHRHLVAAIDGILPRSDFAAFAGPSCIDRASTHGLAGLACQVVETRPAGAYPQSQFRSSSAWAPLRDRVVALTVDPSATTTFRAASPGLRVGINALAFPDFGLFVLRSPRLYLAIRCGPIGQRGNGGHDHNDQLSLTLFLDGIAHVVDPGTDVYTPLPALRNTYRSVRAHFAPRVDPDREPSAEFDTSRTSLFRLDGATPGRCMHFSRDGFIGSHSGYGADVFRMIEVTDGAVVVVDAAAPGIALKLPTPHPDVPLSPGYGRGASVSG